MPVSKREILPGGRSPALRLERYADSLGEPEGETPRQVLDVLLANPSGSTPGRARPSRPCQTLDANDANDANLRPTMPTKAIEANKRRETTGGAQLGLSQGVSDYKGGTSCHALAMLLPRLPPPPGHEAAGNDTLLFLLLLSLTGLEGLRVSPRAAAGASPQRRPPPRAAAGASPQRRSPGASKALVLTSFATPPCHRRSSPPSRV